MELTKVVQLELVVRPTLTRLEYKSRSETPRLLTPLKVKSALSLAFVPHPGTGHRDGRTCAVQQEAPGPRPLALPGALPAAGAGALARLPAALRGWVRPARLLRGDRRRVRGCRAPSTQGCVTSLSPKNHECWGAPNVPGAAAAPGTLPASLRGSELPRPPASPSRQRQCPRGRQALTRRGAAPQDLPSAQVRLPADTDPFLCCLSASDLTYSRRQELSDSVVSSTSVRDNETHPAR